MIYRWDSSLKRYIFVLLAIVLTTGLAACSGGGGGSDDDEDDSDPDSVSRDVTGGGVKGPLANAVVTVFGFDSTVPGFQGSVETTASTDASAAITGLSLPFPLNPPYIMEFTSTTGTTTDITTGQFPVIATLRTVITQSLLDSGEQIYATPLTTMAVDIAVNNAVDNNGTAGIQADEFETALGTAASQVVSTLGFGMPGDIDIFDVPPLVDDTTDTSGEQANVAAYRSAVEALTAVVFEMQQQSTASSTEELLTELGMDLADGNIDGMIASVPSTLFTSTTLDVLAQDPASLTIPNTTQTVGDVQAILISETATTGTTTSTTELDSGGSITTTTEPAETNPDLDGDNVLNADDAFPEDASESVDTDNDGIGDNADPDDDNNGILDEDEGQTPAPTGSDADGDGFDDSVDNCPANFNPSQTDTDGDGDGDACDSDDDGDGAPDGADAFPLDANEQSDADSDGTGDKADTDDDNDGIDDTTENASGGSADHDNDGKPNREDIDSDNDGVLDRVDFDPYDNAVTLNNAPITADSSVSTNEDVAVAVLLNVSDDGVAPGALNYIITGPSNGALSGTEPNLTYTPNAQFSGSDNFTFTVTDGAGKVSNVSAVSIIVTSINDAPVIAQSGPLAVNMDEDGSPDVFVAPTINATDSEGDTLSWTGSAASDGTATVSGTGASPTISYVPNANFNGIDSFSVTVGDGNGGSASITVDVTVDAQPDAPLIAQAGPLSVTMDEDGTPIAFVEPVISASDADGDVLSWSGTVANNGTASITGVGTSPTVGYTPNANFNGSDSFDVTVADGNGGSDTITVNVTVTARNDGPSITQGNSVSVTMDEDSSPTAFLAPTIDAFDSEGDALSWSGSGAGNGIATVSGVGASPTISYAPNTNFNGSDSFDVTVSDGNGGSATITLNLTINAQNDAPTIGGSPAAAVVEGLSYSFTPTANDIDGDALSFGVQNMPVWTTLDTSSGELFGIPDSGDVGGDFTNIIISVTAGGDTVALAPFSITVNPAATSGAVWDNFNWDDGSEWQ